MSLSVGVIGAGYVGLVAAAGLAELGHSVRCFEHDANRRHLLQSGSCSIHEPGLAELLASCQRQGTLTFPDSIAELASGVSIVVIAVGTPSSADGAVDLTQLDQAVTDLAVLIEADMVIAIKSTVPPGTCSSVESRLRDHLKERNSPHEVHVVSNPEFLKEGDAVADFRRPDRIVIGSNSSLAIDLMRRLYAPILRNHDRLIAVDPESAELGKYASNAMLAARVSFMNEMSGLSRATGADIEDIRKIMGMDRRIGKDFLYAGPGFGGSCFPKDLRALVHMAENFGLEGSLLRSILSVNEHQKRSLVLEAERRMGSLSDRVCSLWGLTFKPNTDDLREAPSLTVISMLLERGAHVRAYDPAISSHGRDIDQRVHLCADKYEALRGADQLIVLTEWKEFRSPDFSEIFRLMGGRSVIDGRNLWDPEVVRAAGLSYFGVGRPSSA